MNDFETGSSNPEPMPLLQRVTGVFHKPRAVMTAVAENPTWVGPLLLLLGLGVLAAFLIPEEVVEQSTRKMLSKMPGIGGAAAAELDSQDLSPTSVTNLLSLVFTTIVACLLTALWALLLFRGILGGEGRFKQYFSMVLIAGFVAFAGGLVSIPLQIRSNDLFATLSVGTLLPFLGEGFLRTWMNAIGLFTIWESIVLGIGATCIDKDLGRVGATLAFLLPAIAIAMVGSAVWQIFS
jgi:hypothetical protein